MIAPILSMFIATVLLAGQPRGDDKILLLEEQKSGDTAVVSLEFKITGQLMPVDHAGKTNPQKLTAKGGIRFEEKILPAESDGVGDRSIRYYVGAAVESVVEGQGKGQAKRTVTELRESVRLGVAEFRKGRPFVFSPTGPFTAEELELVEGTFDSLTVGGLLPLEAVAVGDTWKLTDGAAAAIFHLDGISKCVVILKLDSADDAVAKISLSGTIEGADRGSESKLSVKGSVQFDRKRLKITRLELQQTDERKGGFVEPAFKLDAAYTFIRNLDAPVARVNDKELDTVPVRSNAATEMLIYSHSDGRFRFYYPRGWFVYSNEPQQVVLRLIEDGEFIAQCNVSAATAVAAGTHMKPDDFRSQVEKAIGKMLDEVIQEGEVKAEKGTWVYRVAASGAADKQPVVWYYLLAASPQGQQLVFTYTMHAAQVEHFAAKDLAMVGTLEFEPAKTAKKPK